MEGSFRGMAVNKALHFDRFSGVKQFDVTGKTLLMPDMAPFASKFLAAAFRAVGVNAVVMETYKGLAWERSSLRAKSVSPAR